ncbi:class I SAM-dependent methyltransferase [Streptomyces olivaceoviridis]|jgi:SAM-dependent methyltransferase|uniref:class I SAM-dependent methyltransferase n=1 Tax=Streptomyces olivaceoviridis TaxID=1921 RepID=UPI000720B89B|nr:Methyltransferase [Streptomyces hygroscopicus subsp. limoneus]
MNTTVHHTPEVEETIYRLDGPLRWALGEVQGLLRTAQAAPGQRVLDVGAGTGYATIPAARAVGPDGSVHGVDGSAPLLKVLERRAAKEGLSARVTTQVGALAPLDVPTSSVDLVLCTYVLHELAEDAALAVAEMHRVLKPGGRVAIADYRKTPDIARNREIEAWYARQPDGAGPDERHLRFSLEELEQMLRGAGFQQVELRTWHDFHTHAIATR